MAAVALVSAGVWKVVWKRASSSALRGFYPYPHDRKGGGLVVLVKKKMAGRLAIRANVLKSGFSGDPFPWFPPFCSPLSPPGSCSSLPNSSFLQFHMHHASPSLAWSRRHPFLRLYLGSCRTSFTCFTGIPLQKLPRIQIK